MASPTSVRIRNYDVGFGDCFLLTFGYAGNVRRHVLIDFGSHPAPKRKNAGDMPAIAAHIAKECGKDLKAVVATHRHADHISGFTTKKGGAGPGDIIRKCAPDVVIQPWTEHPDAATKATSLGGLGKDDGQAITALRDIQGFMQSVVDYAKDAKGWSKSLKNELAFLGS